VNTGTVVYSFPFLQFVFGNFFIASELALTTVSTPRLRKTTGVYLLQNNDVMTNFDASSLISGDGVGVVDSAIITTASFPALTTAGAFFAIRDNPALVTATAPLLATIATGPFQFTNTTVLSTLVLPSLTTIGTDIMGAASGVASISFIALTAVGGSVTCGSCVALVDVNWPNVIFQDGTLIDFTGDVLNNTSVNMVLARGVASGTTTSDYELNNPGNAAPNGQGLLDKATLIGLGNTVNTN
jgi:hypothetical protein